MNRTCRALTSMVWGSGLVALMLLMSGFGTGSRSIFADDEKPGEATETPETEIEPIGEPATYRRPADGPAYFIWRTGDVWHVQTKTKTAKHEFKGKISLDGGKITKVSGFGNLESGLKRKKGKSKPADDIGRLNDARNQIDFTFHTAGSEDGFSFTVDKQVKAVKFDLKVDGKPRKDLIRIGKKDNHPSKIPFVLSMPEKTPPKNEPEKE